MSTAGRVTEVKMEDVSFETLMLILTYIYWSVRLLRARQLISRLLWTLQRQSGHQNYRRSS